MQKEQDNVLKERELQLKEREMDFQRQKARREMEWKESPANKPNCGVMRCVTQFRICLSSRLTLHLGFNPSKSYLNN